MSKVGVYEPNTTEEDGMKTVSLTDSVSGSAECSKKRVPKRVLHFCDGTLEEYSTDEEEFSCVERQYETQLMQTNTGTLPWMPWLWYHTVHVGNKALGVCDYLGESLANLFGIISPKYEYEIEHYKRMIAEEEEKRKKDIELGAWSDNPSATGPTSNPVLKEPQRY